MSVIDTRLPAMLASGKPLFGMFVGFPSPAIVEMCGHAGFDFVVLDTEHGPADIETVEHLIRAARCANVIPIVRTYESHILRMLDIGASGIQVPMVSTAEQARRIVAAAKIETREALENLDEILKVPGIDALFIGPNDLSFALGHPGDMRHPEVASAIEGAIKKIAATKIAPGLMTVAAEDYHKYAALGARYLTTQISNLLAAAMKSAIAAVRPAAS